MKSIALALGTAAIVGSATIAGQVFAHNDFGSKNGPNNPEVRQEVLQDQADWLGLSTDELWSELKDKSFKDVALEHGKTEEELKQHRQEVRAQRKENREAKHEERKQNITTELKNKGFTDEQIGSIFEVLDAQRPNHQED